MTEGRAILAEEFGPDYGVYFSILSAIASGVTTSSELKTIVGADVNGYLTKLEDQYALERYFHWKFVEEKSYTTMGAWWGAPPHETDAPLETPSAP